MPKNDAARLRHILDAAKEAVALARDRSREDLDIDRMLNLSLVRLLEIIGEAARGVSPSLREAYPEVVWPKMVGMRDRLIHAYYDVNLEVVWQTVTEDLPPLVAQLEKIVAGENF